MTCSMACDRGEDLAELVEDAPHVKYLLRYAFTGLCLTASYSLDNLLQGQSQ